MLAEIVGERYLGMIGGNQEAVDFGQRTEGRRTGHKEIAEQPWIRRGRRRHFDEKAVKRLCFFRRCKQINIIALTNRMRFDRRENFFVPHNQGWACPIRNQSAPQEGAIGRHRISDNLARQLPGQIELDAPRQWISPRERYVELARGQGHRPSLDQQGGQHNDKGDIEKQTGRGKSDQQRNRGKKDSDSPAQAVRKTSRPRQEDAIPSIPPVRSSFGWPPMPGPA